MPASLHCSGGGTGFRILAATKQRNVHNLFWNNSNNVLLPTLSNSGKYQPKIIRPCDWPFETKVIIVCDQ